MFELEFQDRESAPSSAYVRAFMQGVHLFLFTRLTIIQQGNLIIICSG